jgi:hypothetical protein
VEPAQSHPTDGSNDFKNAKHEQTVTPTNAKHMNRHNLMFLKIQPIIFDGNHVSDAAIVGVTFKLLMF